MNAIFDRIIRESFPDIHTPHWKRWTFRAALDNEVFSRLINDERLINKNGMYWVSSVIDFFSVRCEMEYSDFNGISRQGVIVVISNHPTVMDGVALVHTITQARRDIKIVVSHILPMMFPQVTEFTASIRDMAGKMNHKKFRGVSDHLKDGSVLIACPAGKLASWSLSGLQKHQWDPGFL